MIREAVFKITENCCCDCSFCDSKEKYNKILKKRVLPYDEWIKICDKLIENGLEVVVISGGEPLLETETTLKLINYLHEHNIFVVLNTSGILFKNNPDLLLKVISNYPDLVVFSVDSIDYKKHDANRGIDGLFDSVVESIKNIKKLGDYPVAIRTVITKTNYYEIPEIVNYFNKLGVDCIKLTNIENDSNNIFSLNKNELDEFNNIVKPKIFDELKKCSYVDQSLMLENISKIEYLLSNKNVNYDSISKGIFSPDLVGNKPCDLDGRFVAIQSNGDLLPCCEAEHHYYPILGNIVNSNIDDVMNSSIYIDFSHNRPDYCKYCTQRHNLQLDFNKRIKKVDRR